MNLWLLCNCASMVYCVFLPQAAGVGSGREGYSISRSFACNHDGGQESSWTLPCMEFCEEELGYPGSEVSILLKGFCKWFLDAMLMRMVDIMWCYQYAHFPNSPTKHDRIWHHACDVLHRFYNHHVVTSRAAILFRVFSTLQYGQNRFSFLSKKRTNCSLSFGFYCSEGQNHHSVFIRKRMLECDCLLFCVPST